MNSYHQTLKKVGVALIIVGCLDVAMMIYCIMNGISYSSCLNIFAVIAGIFLCRGGLNAALFVSWFSAFLLSIIVGALLIFPIFFPFDLIITYLKLQPLSLLTPIIFGIFIFSLLLWIYKSLTAPHIFKAMDGNNIDRKYRWKKPTTGFIAGGCLIILLAIAVPFLIGGETYEKAKIKAQQKAGCGYKFTVSAISVQSSGGKTKIEAMVIAYNDKEIRHIPLSWEK